MLGGVRLKNKGPGADRRRNSSNVNLGSVAVAEPDYAIHKNSPKVKAG